MDLRMNEGYIITDSIHVGEYEFVLGVSQHIPNDFVTWRCNGGDYYYWGHYHNDCSVQKKTLWNVLRIRYGSCRRRWTQR